MDQWRIQTNRGAQVQIATTRPGRDSIRTIPWSGASFYDERLGERVYLIFALDRETKTLFLHEDGAQVYSDQWLGGEPPDQSNEDGANPEFHLRNMEAMAQMRTTHTPWTSVSMQVSEDNPLTLDGLRHTFEQMQERDEQERQSAPSTLIDQARLDRWRERYSEEQRERGARLMAGILHDPVVGRPPYSVLRDEVDDTEDPPVRGWFEDPPDPWTSDRQQTYTWGI